MSGKDRSSNRRKGRRLHLNLTMKLLLATIISVGMGYVVYLAANAIGADYIDRNYTSEEATNKLDAQMEAAFQTYVDDQDISGDDRDAISRWAIDNKCYVTLYFASSHMLYNYYDFAMTQEDLAAIGGSSGISMTQTEYESSYATDDSVSISFADGTVGSMSLFDETPYDYYDYVRVVAIAIGCSAFLVIFLLFIHRKVNYIKRLSDELTILEGGDLDHVVTEKGGDEVEKLAHGINAMRESIREKEVRERRSQEANRKLVTALSHDIRTPLTSLIGYLEILQLHRYDGADQLDHYVESSKTKAYQIKDLSDRMFEYFLVTGSTEELYEKVDIEADALLYSIVEDQLFDLSNNGWKVEENLSRSVVGGTCNVDPEFLRRVFDNVMSNIKKYGDPSDPVKATAVRDGGVLRISISNHIDTSVDVHESTGVGLTTCRKIMADMGGFFTTSNDGGVFTATIDVPVV